MAAGSALELVVGGLPFPHGGPDGVWRYRHAVRPEGPSPLDAQTVTDFLSYEDTHGRPGSVLAEDELSDWQSSPRPAVRMSPASFPTQCCSNAYREGCGSVGSGSVLVCHGAPAEIAARILGSGSLLSASGVTGRSAVDLAGTSTWGEPADSLDHVIFAKYENDNSLWDPLAEELARLGKAVVAFDLR